jgi:UPF0716 protein FxsA
VLLRLGLLFFVVPLVELALLIWVGRVAGLWPTLLLVAGTGLLGAALAQREGVRALVAAQRELAQGRVPARPLFSGAAVLVGGAFLLTPGVLTDIVGFFLLLPPTRELAFRWLQRRIEAGIKGGMFRMTVWGVNADEWTASPRTEADRRRHGDSGIFPFTWESGTRRPPDTEDPDSEDGPPRSGEIIQD